MAISQQLLAFVVMVVFLPGYARKDIFGGSVTGRGTTLGVVVTYDDSFRSQFTFKLTEGKDSLQFQVNITSIVPETRRYNLKWSPRGFENMKKMLRRVNNVNGIAMNALIIDRDWKYMKLYMFTSHSTVPYPPLTLNPVESIV
ncbi:hypothetical protein FOL47_002127 [Perkinsus chesapeaki]|uniref:Uncharacterized protein n=1 Tax=Perkinsus chesapeaki TaxID=330153 RepID=A0A7J6MF63_PERCH|nr:hypothetical protein FOL47_002127 [Perkinsus chesapeaki]